MFDSDVQSAGDAPPWLSGQTYAQFRRVLDPVDGRRFFRRIAGGGTTRPALDINNWSLDGFGFAASGLGIRPVNYGNSTDSNGNAAGPHTAPYEGATKAGALQLSARLGAANAPTDVLSLTGRGKLDVLSVIGCQPIEQTTPLITKFSLIVDGTAYITDFELVGRFDQYNYRYLCESGSLVGGPQSYQNYPGTVVIGWLPFEIHFERSLVLRAKCNVGGLSVSFYPRYKLFP